MSDVTPVLPAETGGYETTRFNALRHGVLSRYTVLPWEDEGEYRVLLNALVAEHAPQGPTEELYRTRFSGHKAGYAAAGMSLRCQAARASSGLRRPFFSISQAAL